MLIVYEFAKQIWVINRGFTFSGFILLVNIRITAYRFWELPLPHSDIVYFLSVNLLTVLVGIYHQK